MPGLEMPVRGGGAAMLRELRDEERPALENQNVENQEELPKKDEPGNTALRNQPDNKTDQSYDNLTNNQPEQKTSNKPDKSPRKQTNKLGRQPAIKPESLSESQSVGQSVADMIRRRAAQREEQEVLKTVTLKLSPALDEKVEQYCFDNKMKKQEFWAEAAALYFEMIAEGEES